MSYKSRLEVVFSTFTECKPVAVRLSMSIPMSVSTLETRCEVAIQTRRCYSDRSMPQCVESSRQLSLRFCSRRSFARNSPMMRVTLQDPIRAPSMRSRIRKVVQNEWLALWFVIVRRERWLRRLHRLLSEVQGLLDRFGGLDEA